MSSPRTGILSLIRINFGQKILTGWIKGIILGTQLLFFQNLGLIDKLLLEHVGLPHILDLAVHLVNFLGWMSQGGHSEPLLLGELFY